MLAIAGGKGGTGKTTTTLALGDALPGTPLVVDADREMPNLHALASVDREPTLADAVAASRDVDDAAQSTADFDCLVLPAPTRSAPPTHQLLDRLASAGDDVSTVLVDCPAGAAPDAVEPLRVVDAVVLVSPLCAAALRDTAKTAAMARALGTPVVGAVLTRTRLRPPSVAALFDCPVLGAVPSASTGAAPLDDAAVCRSYATTGNRLRDAIEGVTSV